MTACFLVSCILSAKMSLENLHGYEGFLLVLCQSAMAKLVSGTSIFPHAVYQPTYGIKAIVGTKAFDRTFKPVNLCAFVTVCKSF